MADVDGDLITTELAALRDASGDGGPDPLVVAIYLEEALSLVLSDDLLEGSALDSGEAIGWILDRYQDDP